MTKTCRLGILLALLLGVLLSSSSTEALERFRLDGLDGGTLTEVDLGGRDALMVVWATWSPRCQDIARRFEALEHRWGDRLQIVSVVFQEDADTVRAFFGGALPTGMGATYIDTDGSFAKQFDVATLPTLLLIRNDEVVYRDRLPTDPDPTIERLLADE